MYLSKITIIGHCGKAAEQVAVGDKQIIRFTVAVNAGYGEKKVTNWFDVCTFKTIPQWKLDLLNKGANVVVIGDFKETITEKDGKNYHHLNINADSIEIWNKKEAESTSSDTDDVVPF